MGFFNFLRRKKLRGGRVKISKNFYNSNAKSARPVLPLPSRTISNSNVKVRMAKSQAELRKFAGDQRVGMVRTEVSKSRLESHPDFKRVNGVEFFKNRRIIGRDMKVNGGIYTGAGAREAIVVDRKYGELNKLFKKVEQKIGNEKNFSEREVLNVIFGVVDKAIPIKDNDAVERLVKEHGVQQDGKIALDVFLKEGIGVCRHAGLTLVDLGQQSVEKGFLKGKFSVDRNTKPVVIEGKKFNAGHAWGRYTNRNGEVFIIDPMHGKIKKLSELELRSWESGGDWDYRRAGD